MTTPHGHNGGPDLAADLEIDTTDGGITLYRRMRNHPLVGMCKPVPACDPDRGSASRMEAWIDLLMECAYTGQTIRNGGREMKLNPGELKGARSWLADRWNWSPKTVRVFLEQLEAAGMVVASKPGVIDIQRSNNDQITLRNSSEAQQLQNSVKWGPQKGPQKGQQRGREATILSICKYALYQLGSSAAELLEGPAKGPAKGPARGQQGASKGPANTVFPVENALFAVSTVQNEVGTGLAPHARASRLFEDDKKEGSKKESSGSKASAATTAYARQNSLTMTDTAIAHEKFTISIEALYMQLNGTVSREICRNVAMGFAEQWKAEFDAGTVSTMPAQPVAYIRGYIAKAKAAGQDLFAAFGDASDCHWRGDRLVVQQPFRGELLALANGSEARLDALLAKTAGNIPLAVTGLELRKAVRAGVVRNADWDSRDERKAKAAETRFTGQPKAGYRISPDTIRFAKPALD